MERKTVVSHAKGQKHLGKTKWSAVRRQKDKPPTDAENPELAFRSGKVFRKAGK